MWQRLRNTLHSLSTYSDLSPDLALRRQVQQRLGDRPSLSLSEWHTSWGQSLGLSAAVSQFAYDHFEQYCGLSLGQLLPGDRLEADLSWSQICWFDWQADLCDDLWQRFEQDLSDDLLAAEPETLGDLLLLLETHISTQG